MPAASPALATLRAALNIDSLAAVARQRPRLDPWHQVSRHGRVVEVDSWKATVKRDGDAWVTVFEFDLDDDRLPWARDQLRQVLAVPARLPRSPADRIGTTMLAATFWPVALLTDLFLGTAMIAATPLYAAGVLEWP